MPDYCESSAAAHATATIPLPLLHRHYTVTTPLLHRYYSVVPQWYRDTCRREFGDWGLTEVRGDARPAEGRSSRARCGDGGRLGRRIQAGGTTKLVCFGRSFQPLICRTVWMKTRWLTGGTRKRAMYSAMMSLTPAIGAGSRQR